MNRKIKILYPMTGDKMGGSHIVFYHMISNLPKWIEPVIYLDQEGDFSSFLVKNSINYKLLNSERLLFRKSGIFINFLNFITSFIYWLKLFKDEEIDLIHVSDDPMIATCIPYARISRKPCIWYHHNILSDSRGVKFANYISKYNIFASYYLKKLTNHIDGKIIYNPVDLTASFCEKSPFKQTTANKKIKIGFFSNFYVRKRPDFFISAINELTEKFTNIEAFMFGNDADITSEYLIDFTFSLGINNIITISNFKQNIQDTMRDMDLIVAPARHEPFGRVIIEAMSLKVPVIAAEEAGHIEIITNGVNGILFEPDNVFDFVVQAELLLGSEQKMNEITKNAYQDVIKKYSIENHMNELISFYEKVLYESKKVTIESENV